MNKINRYKDISRKSFDKKSSNYDETWDGRFCISMYEEVLKKAAIQPFESVLDVGCGTGTMLSMIINDCKEVKTCGIDFSEKMIERASALLGNHTQLVTGDVEKLPWQDNSFDLVICNASFHHYPEPLKVLLEMRRILKADGRVIIADPWWSSSKRVFINLFLDSPFNYFGDVRIYSRQEMYNLLARCGFTSIEWQLSSKKYSISMAVAGK